MIAAVIGKNFGDEGKGLAVDYFSGRLPYCMVVKHNGGAQAGHTVVHRGRRFVFHQLSSGSFRGAGTYLASTYYPDLYKFREEYDLFGNKPDVSCSMDAPLIFPDDVLINMALEERRGDKRHGSCGMGINEGNIRTEAGAGLFARDVFGMSAESVAAKMAGIREGYGRKRLRETGLDACPSEYNEMLSSPNVLINAAEEMLKAAELINPVEDEAAFLREQENIIFETGQGLLLDADNETYAPHVSASKTGLHNVALLLKDAGLILDEACYVTRTYVTRHGAGFLPCETAKEKIGNIAEDKTNITNNWQGAIRYAKHASLNDFLTPVQKDLRDAYSIYPGLTSEVERPVSLFITHMNETDSKIVFEEGSMDVCDFLSDPGISAFIGAHYLSESEGLS